MRFASPFRTALVLVGLSALVAAQATKPAEPVRSKAAAVPVEPNQLVLPVLGLSKENAGTVRADLLALSNEVFVCPSCGLEQTREGTCPKDKTALEPESRALFTAVEPSKENDRLELTLDPRLLVRLSRIEATLARRSVKIDDEHFQLAGRLALLVRASMPDDPSEVEKALADTKLFEEVKAQPDRETNQIVIAVRAGASAPTRAKVIAALDGVQARLTDVVWGHVVAKS